MLVPHTIEANEIRLLKFCRHGCHDVTCKPPIARYVTGQNLTVNFGALKEPKVLFNVETTSGKSESRARLKFVYIYFLTFASFNYFVILIGKIP